MNICQSELSTRFLEGVLTASESAAFETHLEICPCCLEKLEQEAGGEAAWQSARELLIHQLPQTTNWVSSAEDSSDRVVPDSEWLPACTSSVVLSILAPSDDPEFVGRIGSYEISGVVGRGSAGIVLRGFDRALHRNVAIKVLDPAMAGVGAARQRFAREARAMAAISHEHVVPVYEVNEHAGLPFFVMEYVPGGSLERRLRTDGTFDTASVVRIGLQTAQALAAAHANGLVHRDIKPGNILLDRGTERVRVADFGLVRVANDVSCTRSGFIAGTPQYMAPEQVRAEICDGRSDLFSLGSVMYALCTGHAPFRADTVYGVMQRIVHDAPRSIRESNPQIPEWLDEFILRLMSKERVDRFANADEVVRLLQAELAMLQNPGQDSHGIAFGRGRYSLAKIATKRRSVVAICGAVLTALLSVALGIVWWQNYSTRTIVATQGQANPTSKSNRPSDLDQHRASDIPILIPSSDTDENTWDVDGTSSVRFLADTLEAKMYAPANEVPHDSWNEHITELRERMRAIAVELDAETNDKPQFQSP